MPSRQYRSVCFTSFQEDPPVWNEREFTYLIYGRESCPETGRSHWQCFVELSRRVTTGRLQQLFGNCHFESRNGSADQAANYCKKDNQFVEFGSLSIQGQRSDLDNIGRRIINGESITSLAMEFPGKFIQYGRGFREFDATIRGGSLEKFREVNVEIWYGETNQGKTRRFYDSFFPDCYSFHYSKNNDWFSGYAGQKAILFDEFNGQILLSNMLKYCDGYPCQLELKGSFTFANWNNVIIITNDNPQSFYSNANPEKRKAFARRINKVVEFKQDSRFEQIGFVFDFSSVSVSADVNFS